MLWLRQMAAIPRLCGRFGWLEPGTCHHQMEQLLTRRYKVTGAIRRDAEGDEMRRIVCREFCPPDCCTTSTSSGKEAQDPSQAPPSRWPKLARCPDHLRAGADHRGASCQAALNRRAWARLAGRAVSGAQH